MLKVIGGAESGEFKAVASGTLPNGKPVVVNADGTVSAVTGASQSQSLGTPTVFETQAIEKVTSTYDAANDRVVVAYKGGSNYGTACVGTVSGTSITFGTPVVFWSNFSDWISIDYDTTAEKVLICWRSNAPSEGGRGVVGTVSGTSISFGSVSTFTTNIAARIETRYSSTAGKFGVFFTDVSSSEYGRRCVATISGTSVSFGGVSTYNSAQTRFPATCYDSTNNKFVTAYRNSTGVNYAISHTLSGTGFFTSIAATEIYGSSDTPNYADAQQFAIAHDPDQGLNLWVFRGATAGAVNNGEAKVIKIDGSSFTIGSLVEWDTTTTTFNSIAYDSTAKKFVVAYKAEGLDLKGYFVTATVSGTTPTFSSDTQFENGEIASGTFVTSLGNGTVVISYEDDDNLDRGTSVVLAVGYENTNLTAENYIGVSRGVVSSSGSAGRTGSETVFEAATSRYVSSAYDSNSGKVVIAYADNGNLQYGTAIVGTVSGTTISFGSPVVFESAEVQNVGVTFDSNSNKVVITYADEGNSSYPTAIVGTVSGTSISFGTPVVVDSANADSIVSTFDSTNNKVVVGFKNPLGNQYPKAIVGTVSGTSISFGASAIIESVVIGSNRLKLAYDSNSGKVVSVYDDTTNSLGRSAIGTVSGTSISFGTPVTFVSNLAASLGVPVIDSDTNKVIITYKDNGNLNYGTAKVGTISGTSISFGAASVFNQGNTELYSGQEYNPTLQKVIVAFRDDGDSNIGKYVYGTVSGTDITFSTEVSFNSGRADNLTMVYDPVSTNMVLSFEDNANSSHGTSLVFSPDTLVVTRGEVTDGNVASVDIIGSVSDNQLSLTPGSKYYVQNDGTLSTTTGTPSVLAGTAIASNKLIVKT